MNIINTFILWIWVLSISLLIPTSLPAGGYQKILIEKRENSLRTPLIALEDFDLLSSINHNSSIVTNVQAGTPVQVVKIWESTKGGTWLLVNVFTSSSYQLFLKRGWVNIGSS